MSAKDIERLGEIVRRVEVPGITTPAGASYETLTADILAAHKAHAEAIARAILKDIQKNPGEWVLDHLGDALGDTPEAHARAADVWDALIWELLED